MGFHSEWQLAFKGPKSKVRKLEKFMLNIISSKKRSIAEQTACNIIVDNKTMVAENHANHIRAIAFGNSNSNCDKIWDDLIDELLKEARTKHKIKASYARLGIDMDDYEFDCDDDLDLGYSRYLTEVDL